MCDNSFQLSPNSPWPVTSRHDRVVTWRACRAHIPACPSHVTVIFFRKLPIWLRLLSLWTASITFFGDNRRVMIFNSLEQKRACPVIAWGWGDLSSQIDWQRVGKLTCSKGPMFRPRLAQRGTRFQCWHIFSSLREAASSSAPPNIIFF